MYSAEKLAFTHLIVALAELDFAEAPFSVAKKRLKQALLSLIEVKENEDNTVTKLKQLICYNLAVINYCEIQEYIERLENKKDGYED